jgi:hypothetical protein
MASSGDPAGAGGVHSNQMARPRISTVAAAGIASAVAFTVITRSGLAGTLAGAAVASMVITGATHGLVHVFDRLAAWWQRRRVGDADAPPVGLIGLVARAVPATDNEVPEDGGGVPAGGGSRPGGKKKAATRDRDRPRWQKRAVLVAPYALAVIALGFSGYSLVTGTPIERVIVRERVLQPGTTVISVVTVTVPVTTSVSTPPAAATHTATTATTLPRTTTTFPGPSTSTTTGPPPSTATTQAASPTTTAAPGAP